MEDYSTSGGDSGEALWTCGVSWGWAIGDVVTGQVTVDLQNSPEVELRQMLLYHLYTQGN